MKRLHQGKLSQVPSAADHDGGVEKGGVAGKAHQAKALAQVPQKGLFFARAMRPPMREEEACMQAAKDSMKRKAKKVKDNKEKHLKKK